MAKKPATEPGKRPGRKPVPAKQKAQPLSASVPPELKRRVELLARRTGRRVSQIVSEALEAYLVEKV